MGNHLPSRREVLPHRCVLSLSSSPPKRNETAVPAGGLVSVPLTHTQHPVFLTPEDVKTEVFAAHQAKAEQAVDASSLVQGQCWSSLHRVRAGKDMCVQRFSAVYPSVFPADPDRSNLKLICFQSWCSDGTWGGGRQLAPLLHSQSPG